MVTLHEMHLDDAEAVGSLVRRVSPKWVFHLAVYGAYPSQTDWRRMVQTNVISTATLAEACLTVGVEAFVNTGSSSEYGFKSFAPTERESLEPSSYYGVTKASATLCCRYLARQHGARMPTLRLYSVFGPYEEPGRFIPALIVRGLQGELPPLAAPDTARDFVYIDDVVEAYLLAAANAAQEPGAIYNVGTGIQTKLRDAVETARHEFNIVAPATWGSMPSRAWDTSVWVADASRIKADLGWEPKYTFEQGLRATVAWLRSHSELLPVYSHAQPHQTLAPENAPRRRSSASRRVTPPRDGEC